MKLPLIPRRAMPAVSLLAALAMLGSAVPPALAAPPVQKRQSTAPRAQQAQQQNGLKKLGGFLFGSSRRPARIQLQAGQPVSTRRPAVRGETLYAAPAAPQEMTGSRPEIAMAADGRTRLVLPVVPGAPSLPAAGTGYPASRELGPDPSQMATPLPTANLAVATEPPPVMYAGPIPDHPEYGVRVPGSRGYVRPPGTAADSAYVLDVRDLSPGEKVRDPKTGRVFLVPPF